MSETNTAVPASVESTGDVENSSSSFESGEGEQAQNEQQMQEALEELAEINPKAKVKVKVNGKEKLITVEEALKKYELGEGAYEKFKEASQMKKQAAQQEAQFKELLEVMKTPEGLFSVAEALNISTKDLKKLLDMESSLTPEQKRLRDLERREQAILEKERREEYLREQAEIEKLQRQWVENIRTSIGKHGLPQNVTVFNQVVGLLNDAYNSGFEIDADEAVSLIKEELSKLNMSNPKVQQQEANSKLQPQSKQSQSKNQSKQNKPKRIPSWQLDSEELTDFFSRSK